MWNYLLYLAVGTLGGIIIGALGSGSSLIILPALSLIFPLLFPASIALKMAVATCLATLIIGTISGSLSYLKAKHCHYQLVKLCFPGVIIGSVIAPFTAHFLSVHLLKWYIGLFLIIIGIYKLIRSYYHQQIIIHPLQPIYIIIMSIIAAWLSGMGGVALGIILIPFLSRYTDHKTVIGTNLILAVPYAIISSIGYITSGLSLEHSIPHTVGYIYVPAFIVIAIAMFIFPPLGLKLVRKISVKRMQIIFYTYLLLIGIIILI